MDPGRLEPGTESDRHQIDGAQSVQWNLLDLSQEKPKVLRASNISESRLISSASMNHLPAEFRQINFIDMALKKAEKAAELRGVSEEFGQEVQEAYRSLRPGVQNLLEKNGYRVIAAHHITQVCPYLIGQHPGGWDKRATWDNVEGTVVKSEKAIIVAEYKRPTPTDDLKTADTWINARRPEGVLRHETGHAVDCLLSGDGTLFSRSPEFQAAYQSDINNLGQSDRARLAYYLQESVGAGETFADIFAVLNGGATNSSSNELLCRAFPEVKTLLQSKLDGLDKDETRIDRDNT